MSVSRQASPAPSHTRRYAFATEKKIS